jgi:hypothetical protein
MDDGGATVRRVDLLDGVAGAALLLLGAAALTLAVRLGAAAGGGCGDVLAELRSQAGRRVLTERGQIAPLLEAAGRGDRPALLRAAEAALPRLDGNSQLHLLLAGALREEGRDVAALREYRRAVELQRDYADRRSPYSIAAELSAYLAAAKARLEAAGEAGALRDLHLLERFLAGGCS